MVLALDVGVVVVGEVVGLVVGVVVVVGVLVPVEVGVVRSHSRKLPESCASIA